MTLVDLRELSENLGKVQKEIKGDAPCVARVFKNSLFRPSNKLRGFKGRGKFYLENTVEDQS